MNLNIYTFYALKTVKIKRFFRKPIVQTIVISTTRASNWMWAERNFLCDGIKFDEIVKAV